jgi:hypothetical protein
VYIAYHDSDDTDVKSCGKLLGFSALGSYELETAYTTSAGLTAANAAGLGIQVSTTDGSLTITGAGDHGGSTIVLGRTSTAAVDLSNSQRGGYAVNLGEDDSSDAWGSSGSAAAGDVKYAFASNGTTDGFDVTLTVGTHSATVNAGWNTSINQTTSDVKDAIDVLLTTDQTLDAAISSIVLATNTIKINTYAGTANNVVLTAAADGTTDTMSATDDASGAQGTDATSTTSKEVLRWVTTAS